MPRRSQEGTAFAEALVALPIFVAALIAVIGFNNLYSAKLEAMSRARRMAWLQAESGECPTTSCDTPECRAQEQRIEGEFDAAANTNGDGKSLGDWMGGVSDFLLGKSTEGVGLFESPMPNALGGKTEQRGLAKLRCNTKPRSFDGEEGSILEAACTAELRNTEYAQEACK